MIPVEPGLKCLDALLLLVLTLYFPLRLLYLFTMYYFRSVLFGTSSTFTILWLSRSNNFPDITNLFHPSTLLSGSTSCKYPTPPNPLISASHFGIPLSRRASERHDPIPNPPLSGHPQAASVARRSRTTLWCVSWASPAPPRSARSS